MPPAIFPPWMDLLCSLTLILGLIGALAILIDVLSNPPRMPVMTIVWPVCALFGIGFVVWLYFSHGREDRDGPRKPTPFSIIVAKGSLHCGAGCTLGDIVGEWLAFVLPAVAIAGGWHWLFEDKIYAVWLLDFLLAFAFGIAFQYFAIAPMRHISGLEGIVAALKADTLSLAAWQIGMYCLMACLQLVLFKHAFGGYAPVFSVEFWAAMQLAMIAGFMTSYPMNWWLIRAGIKESM